MRSGLPHVDLSADLEASEVAHREARVGAYFKQVALLEQDYAKDNKLSVAKVLSDAGLTVSDFARFKVGA